jgi:hypothetical protein
VDWMRLTQDRDQLQALVYMVMNFWVLSYHVVLDYALIV